jgi:hypothetical protein
MPATLAILVGQIIQRVYAMPLVADPARPDLSDLGCQWFATITGTDAVIGAVPYGVIVKSLGHVICAMRGTQNWQEWAKDFQGFLESSPWPGCQWERGFGSIFQTLHVGGIALADALRIFCVDVFGGHSLGCPLATFAGLQFPGGQLILLASPKPGDGNLAALAQRSFAPIQSYANTEDVVPHLPLTLDWPLDLENFRPICRQVGLDPASVTPPIANDPHSAHILANDLLLLEAVA